jgi:hypothetical protein
MVPYRPGPFMIIHFRIHENMANFARTSGNGTYRVNVIDERGTISFLAPSHGLKVLAAAITGGASSVAELLAKAQDFDARWASDVRADVMTFDEHNVDDLSDRFQDAISSEDNPDHPAFRVIDTVTRKRSLVPGALGLVVFNLKERRIIQIQNNYSNLERSDRGRIRINGRPTDMLFRYELPVEWSLVP